MYHSFCFTDSKREVVLIVAKKIVLLNMYTCLYIYVIMCIIIIMFIMENMQSPNT